MAAHVTIVVVDVEGFTNPARTQMHRVAVREGLFEVLRTAFSESEVDMSSCHVEDRGDGLMILVPAKYSKRSLVSHWPDRVAAGLRQHNAAHVSEARIKLRMALHAGEVQWSAHGVESSAVYLAFRILDAPSAKKRFAESGGTLALVTSDSFFHDVIQHDPAADPARYDRISVAVKDVFAEAWLRVVDARVVSGDDLGTSEKTRPGPSTSRDLIKLVTGCRLNSPTLIFPRSGGRSLLLDIFVRVTRTALGRR